MDPGAPVGRAAELSAARGDPCHRHPLGQPLEPRDHGRGVPEAIKSKIFSN